MGKIYDCFMFNGEFELLEIRLKTHWEKIDHFVIVEGNRTFQGKDKDYSILRFSEKLFPYRDKINAILFDVPMFQEKDGSWLACALQRDAMLRGLHSCDKSDFVIFSEIDEIMRPDKISEATQLIESGLESVVFNQEIFCYYFNVQDSDTWDGPRMLKFSTILKKRLSPQIIVNDSYFDRKTSMRLRHSGWHFQNLGGVDRVVKKLRSSCHHELGEPQYSDPAIIINKIKNLIEPLARPEHQLRIVELNETFPECIYSDKEKYKEFIYEPKDIF